MNEDAPRGERLFARLLCDMMMPAELAEALRAQGYEVAEARLLPAEVQQDDDALLQEAVRQGCLLLTCNYSDPQSNFCLIHDRWRTEGKKHQGIILVPQHHISSRLRRWDVRDRLLRFLNRHTWDELCNQIWWLPQE
jgi:predicted nuclease of predicted toxin-antitoxin system